jgi:hypothetical protein
MGWGERARTPKSAPERGPATRAELQATRDRTIRWAEAMDATLATTAAEIHKMRVAFQEYHKGVKKLFDDAIREAPEARH